MYEKIHKALGLSKSRVEDFGDYQHIAMHWETHHFHQTRRLPADTRSLVL